MAFIDRIDAEGTAIAWYVHISGLPYVFSNIDCPSDWDAGGGTVSWDVDGNGAETYTWSPTFQPPRQWGVVGQRAQPFAGFAVSGSLKIPFVADETWLALMARSSTRGGFARLTDDLTSTGTTINVRSTTPLTDAGVTSGTDLYLGTETMEVNTISSGATSFTVATRGRYGSIAQAHIASGDAIFEAGAGGAKICDHMLVLRDRIVRVWVATGTMREGVFTPWGSTIGSTEDSERWVGWTQIHHWSRDLLTIELDCVELTQRFGREVYQRKPTGIAGARDTTNMVRIDAASNKVYAKWVSSGDDIDSANASSGQLGELDGARLQRWNGASYEDVPDGWYTIGQVSAYLSDTWVDAGVWPLPSSNTSADYSMWITPTSNTDGAPIYEVRIWSDDMDFLGSSGWAAEFRALFLRAGPADSLWRELGFTNDALVPLVWETPASDTYSTGVIAADRPPPVFRLPESRSITRRVFYHSPAGPGFDATPGYTDDAGDTVYGYVRVGEEILEFTTTGTEEFGTEAIRYLGVATRGTFGSAAREIYLEQGPSYEPLQIRQCLAFPGCSWQRMALYLLVGGNGLDTGYQRGWRGSGLAFPIDLVDTDSFEATIAGARDLRDNWCLSEPMTLRDILSPELVISQVTVTATDDGTGFAIRAIDMSPPTENEGGASTALGHADIDSMAGFELDDSDDRVVNVIEYRYAFNNGDGKWYGSGEFRLVDSIAMYGAQEPLRVDLRGLGDPDAVQERIHSLGNSLAASFGAPYQKLTVVIGKPSSVWPVQLGDTRALTHEWVPSLDSATRGVSGLAVRVFGKEDRLRDVSPRGSFGSLTVMSAPAGERLPVWAPCAYVTALYDSNTRLRCTANYYSKSGDAADASHFAGDYAVRLYKLGDESSAETRFVDSVSGNDITITSATALSAPFVVEFGAYDSIETAQAGYAYMADGSTELIDDGTDGATAFVYL